ncbi:MAG: hypothetical protein R6V19_01290 [Armatimonadota bacterium]
MRYDYLMGPTADRISDLQEGVKITSIRNERTHTIIRKAPEKSYCDGREHTISLKMQERNCVLSIDGCRELAFHCPRPWRQVSLRVDSANAAIYGIEIDDA